MCASALVVSLHDIVAKQGSGRIILGFCVSGMRVGSFGLEASDVPCPGFSGGSPGANVLGPLI